MGLCLVGGFGESSLVIVALSWPNGMGCNSCALAGYAVDVDLGDDRSLCSPSSKRAGLREERGAEREWKLYSSGR